MFGPPPAGAFKRVKLKSRLIIEAKTFIEVPVSLEDDQLLPYISGARGIHDQSVNWPVQIAGRFLPGQGAKLISEVLEVVDESG